MTIKKFKPLRDKYLILSDYARKIDSEIKKEIDKMFVKHSGPGKLNPFDLAYLIGGIANLDAAWTVGQWRMKVMPRGK